MDECPLVSILTATYNRFDLIYCTIKSVLDQDYQNIEFIITDDGFDHFPEATIREYVEENKKCIRCNCDGGY